MKDRITSRLHDVKRGFKRRPTFTLILIFTCLIIITFALRPTDPTHSLWLNLLPSPSLQSEHSPAGSLIRPREAYVLYNPASLFPELMDNAHLLTIFGLNRDAELRDPCNRDIIVIVTNSTSPADVKRLEEAGALIFHVPYSLRGLLPTRDGWPERYYYVWDKLWVFTLTDYDRVLYLDSDITFNRPIHPIWDDPNAWPEHLASTSDLKDYGPHESPIADAPYFNSGLMMVRPNMTTFDDLLNVEFTDEEPILWPDQVSLMLQASYKPFRLILLGSAQ